MKEKKIGIPKGNCTICGYERMYIKPNHYACPNFYGSPMHNCDRIIFQMRDGLTEEEAIKKEITTVEEVYDVFILEYIEARNKLLFCGDEK